MNRENDRDFPVAPPRKKTTVRAAQLEATADAKLLFLGEHSQQLAMPRPPATQNSREVPVGADTVPAENQQQKILDKIDQRIAEREARGLLSDRCENRRSSSKLVGDDELFREIVSAREEQEDEDFHAIYLTQDIYSMAIFAGAGYCKSELAKVWIFGITLACFVAQVGSLLLAIVDLQPDDTSLVCCTRLLGHPVNVSVTVRAGQWLAVMFSIFSLENVICIDTLAFINALVFKVSIFQPPISTLPIQRLCDRMNDPCTRHQRACLSCTECHEA